MDIRYSIIFGGATLLFLLIFQLASGLRWIRVNPVWHKRTGIALFILAISHAAAALWYLLVVL